MKILHVRNIANVAYNIALEQKRRGHEVRIFEIWTNYTSGSDDISLNLPQKYPKKDIFNRFYTISERLINLLLNEQFDVIHLHAGGIFPMDLDIPVLFKRFGKVIVHWHGSKLRNYGKSFGSRFADAEIVSTPDLLEYAPDAFWIPNCITWHGFKKIERNDGKVVIGHAPTNRFYKGTEYFIETMKCIEKEYPTVECLLIENTLHDETLKLLQNCDIIVDSIGFYDRKQVGWYGVLTNEVQQMEIPCCTWIKSSIQSYLSDNSGITNVTRDNLRQNLVTLIEDENLRKENAMKGLRYVEEMHNNGKIIGKIMELYK